MIRKSMVVSFLEAELMRVNCPFCGRSKCNEHLDLSELTTIENLNKEEQDYVSKILNVVYEEKWGIKLDGDDLNISIVDEKGNILKLELLEETASIDEIRMRFKGCTCMSVCDKCREKHRAKYRFGGPYWDIIKDSEFELSCLDLLDNLNVEEGSEVKMVRSGNRKYSLPTVMMQVDTLEYVVNTAITFEQLQEVKK